MKQFNIQHAWLVLGALSFLPRTVVAQDEVKAEAPLEAEVVSTSVDSRRCRGSQRKRMDLPQELFGAPAHDAEGDGSREWDLHRLG